MPIPDFCYRHTICMYIECMHLFYTNIGALSRKNCIPGENCTGRYTFRNQNCTGRYTFRNQNCTGRYTFRNQNCTARYNFSCEKCTGLAKSVPGSENNCVSIQARSRTRLKNWGGGGGGGGGGVNGGRVQRGRSPPLATARGYGGAL